MTECEEELICDLAETYGIYDWKQMPQTYISILTAGLRDESRVKMKLSGQRLTTDQGFLVVLIDQLNWVLWQRSGKKSGKPKSLYKQLTEPQKPKEDLAKFSSEEDFDKWYERKHKR